jgi:hypothetical protein
MSKFSINIIRTECFNYVVEAEDEEEAAAIAEDKAYSSEGFDSYDWDIEIGDIIKLD